MTGVQTCALPILSGHLPCGSRPPSLKPSLPSPVTGLGLCQHISALTLTSVPGAINTHHTCSCPQPHAPGVTRGRPGNGLLPSAPPTFSWEAEPLVLLGDAAGWGAGEGGGRELSALSAPGPGWMVRAVCASLCEEGSDRKGRVHERKAPPDSETLGVGGQDADGLPGREPGRHPERRGGVSKASTGGCRDGQRTRMTRVWKGGDATPLRGGSSARK